ncbi:MAG: MBL fold metallo-hydrolase [Spirochaetia bacterium]|jgi:ribonuclease BN (tRNA processing enzyme)|nr:MBL fold metallo-hydrolase [Spirochaetia bacterium]
MKLTVIGHWGAYPGPGGASSGYLIEESNESLLLDCGSGVLSKLYEYTDISQLNNVVLSHYHADHIADIGCLQYASKVQLSLGERTDPISIYGHTLSDFFNKLSYENASIGKPIEEGTAINIGPFTLHFKHTSHPAPALAMRIESANGSLGYTADTGWNDSLVDFFSGVDLLLCESSLYNEFKGRIEGHLTAGEAGLLAKETRVGQLVLTHMPHFGDHNELKIEAGTIYKGKIDLAESGRTWIC